MSGSEVVDYRILNQVELAGAIEGLHKSIFVGEADSLTIYRSRRVGRWLANRLKDPSWLFVGALLGDRLIGYAQWRMLDDTAHLNYIGVQSALQGRSIGRRLFEVGAAEFDRVAQAKLTLDVEKENAVAVQWYRRLGFEVEEEVQWSRLTSKTEVTADSDCFERISINQEGLRDYLRFGFGLVNWRKLDGSVVPIGLIDESLFRVVVDDSIRPELVQLVCDLAWLDPHREILLLHQGPLDQFSTRLVCRRLRMAIYR